jgi:hypothetical protein
MGKRGPQPKGKVKLEWSSDFAYAIGLIVTDGNLAKNKSRVSLVSKDFEQIENFKNCLNVNNKIGIHYSGSTYETAYRIQICDVLFCNFLNDIGIFPAKSKTIQKIKVPRDYFFDYLRGCFDGDGTVYSYWDKRWKSSFMFYVSFISASKNHIDWLQNEIEEFLGIRGHISTSQKSSVFQLRYAKADSLKIIRKMYKDSDCVCLGRKKLKIKRILAIVGELL